MAPRAPQSDGNEAAFAVVEAIFSLHQQLLAEVSSLLADLGLSPALADTLRKLDPDHSVSRRELADRLHCDPSNVTFLVDRLRERGFVASRTDAHDRRVRALTLTAAGMKARSTLADGLSMALQRSGLKGGQLRQLSALLSSATEANQCEEALER